MTRAIQGPFGIVASQAIYDQNLSPAEFRVLAALASFAGQGRFGEWCSPKQAELAERLGLARQTVSIAVKRLVELGYLLTRNQSASGKGKTGLEYYVRRDFQDGEPMSGKSDIGVVENDLSHCKAPMSEKHDTGADVSATRHPMSAKPDIGHYREEDSKNISVPSARILPKEKKSSGPSEAFLALWREWAAKDEIKRSSRKPAWEAYARLVKDGADEDEIARGVRAFLADSRQTKEGGQFMKAFAVWLKNETWADWAHKPTPQKSTPPSPEQIWAPRYREWLRTDGLIWDFQQWGPAPDEEGHRGPKRFRENKQPQPQEQGVAA